jgi:hypothetical protein
MIGLLSWHRLWLAFEVMGVLHLNVFVQARIWDRASLRKFHIRDTTHCCRHGRKSLEMAGFGGYHYIWHQSRQRVLRQLIQEQDYCEVTSPWLYQTYTKCLITCRTTTFPKFTKYMLVESQTPSRSAPLSFCNTTCSYFPSLTHPHFKNIPGKSIEAMKVGALTLVVCASLHGAQWHTCRGNISLEGTRQRAVE